MQVMSMAISAAYDNAAALIEDLGESTEAMAAASAAIKTEEAKVHLMSQVAELLGTQQIGRIDVTV
ncbi:MAG: hypothetical protein LBN43_02585 [Oscillospiraceae bacterium]|jgi:hypothetical protein|nr:hypothetical protein [Oscillospiraceae bacterium]